MSSQWQVKTPELAELSGTLDRDKVPLLWKELKQWQVTTNQTEVSLQHVDRIDSAGMAMLIHLIEHAKKQNCHIMLSFVPEQLRTLFQLSNIENVMDQHVKNSTG